MPKIVFFMSHLGSGSKYLIDKFCENPRVQLFSTRKNYSNYLDLEFLTNSTHRCNDISAIYLEELLFNHRLTCSRLINYCSMVYFIREPRETLNEIIFNFKYSPLIALRYYQFRLRGMFEYAKRGGFIFNFNDLNKKERFLELGEYIGVQQEFSSVHSSSNNFDLVPYKILQEAQSVYDRYFSNFNKLKERQK